MAKRSNNNLHLASVNTDVEKPNGSTLKIKLDDLRSISPLTHNQKLFFDAYSRGDYFIALHGVAGTGKTFIALYKALEELLDKNNPFSKIIIVRSAVQSRERTPPRRCWRQNGDLSTALSSNM